MDMLIIARDKSISAFSDRPLAITDSKGFIFPRFFGTDQPDMILTQTSQEFCWEEQEKVMLAAYQQYLFK